MAGEGTGSAVIPVGFVTPLGEEMSFRFALLNTVRRVVSTDVRASLLVAVLFAAVHVAGNPTSTPHLVDATWLLVWSVPVGVIALGPAERWSRCRDGVHGTRNLTEVAALR
jgi:membrane protease YdiL (CAAX protease family)